MRRSAAPSFKFSGLGGSNSKSDIQKPKDKDFTFPKAARSTASILSLLNSDGGEEEENGTRNNTNTTSSLEHCRRQSVVIDPPGTKENKPENKRVIDGKKISPGPVCDGVFAHHIQLFNVVWGKQSTKKHKTWEGDGTLEVHEKSVVLKDTEGKVLGQANRKSAPLEEGSRLFIGSKEVEIIDAVTPTPGEVLNQSSSSKRTAETAALHVPQSFKKGKVAPSFQIPVRRPPGSGVLQPQVPLVMPQPPNEHQWKFNTACLPVTNVAVDPFLVRVLRPHQREGVVFLYECITGMRKMDCFGAILADEMGLGKTLQCIALVWTLLKKGPYGGIPVLKRVLVVTPSSLVLNWEKEFLSWLGRERISLFVVDQKKKPRDYGKYKKESVMLISYEMFVRYHEDISTLQFDLLICDEGHRLKNNSIKVSILLTKLRCRRKILLTGTPIQNDLQEFFSLVDFVNPRILNTLQEFHQYYEEPILASRQPRASKSVKELGEKRTSELSSATCWFILRRTQDVINKFLPTKTESVIFCVMSSLQEELYKTAVSYWTNREVLAHSDNVAHLSVITALKKICNHPFLVWDKSEMIAEYLEQMYTNDYNFSIEHSGKLIVLMNLLRYASSQKEKVVVVSYYTQTLDMLASVFSQEQFKYCRLDGSVPSGQRQKIVEQFNSNYIDYFIFLLSARAGGVGLNLTGASRLVLYDCDWNPATDLQAMSRIWRDGQKRAVHIYRLLTTGSIEEKMFQRQLSKTDLSGAIVDSHKKTSIKLSNEELKDLFTIHTDVSCLTHDLLRCDCSGSGEAPGPPEENVEIGDPCASQDTTLLLKNYKPDSQKLHMNELFKWEHHGKPLNISVLQNMGLSDSTDYITYMFRNMSVENDSAVNKLNPPSF
ncbi:DNA repair and recombination protein RAD54-like [Gryllus bimaculatus]|nr:DNA repair and recombination protein RAD54-like [Gryllus bimaculatus]